MSEDEIREECLEWLDLAQSGGYLSGVPEGHASRNALAATMATWVKSIVKECGGTVRP